MPCAGRQKLQKFLPEKHKKSSSKMMISYVSHTEQTEPNVILALSLTKFHLFYLGSFSSQDAYKAVSYHNVIKIEL